MNAITTVTAADDSRIIDVMRASLYPGAKPESVALVLSYCRARNLDPMLKPVHIVPMYVRDATNPNRGEMRDVIMPGIGLYRIQAAETSAYAGKTEPEFGPLVDVELEGRTYRVPEWCRVTVFRMVGGEPRAFTALEYWIENYATAKRDSEAPNAMWTKRARGQLAKCAEAQALRMAFPEKVGGEPTAEEMEGKVLPPREVPNLAAQPAPVAVKPPVQNEPEFIWRTMEGKEVSFPASTWAKACMKALASMDSPEAIREWRSERGGLFASIHESGDAGAALIADAERAIDLRVAELESAA